MRKYIEIVDGNIKLSEIHPYNLNSNIDKLLNIFISDLQKEFNEIQIISKNKRTISIKIPKLNKVFNFYVDHVDSGGHTKDKIKNDVLSKITKKISIDFPNENFRKIISNKKNVYIVNFYFQLSDIDGNVQVDENEYCYIILNPENIYESNNFRKINDNNEEKINSSSRWIEIGKICDFMRNKELIKESIIENNNWKFYLIKPGFFENFYIDISGNKKILQFNEVEREIQPLVEKIMEQGEDVELIENSKYDETTKKRLIECRLGQGEYRKNLLNLYDNQCILSNISHPNILIASHILPWRKSSNNERLDKYNGLLLSSNIDKLFDSFKISFDENGMLVASKDIDDNLLIKIGVNQWFFDNSINEKIDKRTSKYLRQHYKLFLEKNINFK